MTLSRRAFVGLSVAAMALAACLSPPPPPETVIYLVRHAEKQAGDDPSLTTEGLARAEDLADLFNRYGPHKADSSASGGCPGHACRHL